MSRILIIDDETAISIMLKKMVEKAGYEAMTAENGNEGLELFGSFKPDLLITDIVMPEKEGLELIFELRRKNPKLKIIAISGGGRFQYEGYLNSAKHLGANKIFQKPLDLKELMSSISELLSNKELGGKD
jgi:YesN/AraC family two-component response regulator